MFLFFLLPSPLPGHLHSSKIEELIEIKDEKCQRMVDYYAQRTKSYGDKKEKQKKTTLKMSKKKEINLHILCKWIRFIVKISLEYIIMIIFTIKGQLINLSLVKLNKCIHEFILYSASSIQHDIQLLLKTLS